MTAGYAINSRNSSTERSLAKPTPFIFLVCDEIIRTTGEERHAENGVSEVLIGGEIDCKRAPLASTSTLERGIVNMSLIIDVFVTNKKNMEGGMRHQANAHPPLVIFM